MKNTIVWFPPQTRIHAQRWSNKKNEHVFFFSLDRVCTKHLNNIEQVRGASPQARDQTQSLDDKPK